MTKALIERLSPVKDFPTLLAHDVTLGLKIGDRRWLPTKYRYDEIGSELFEKIARTPEYYLTRVEEEILKKHAKEVMQCVKFDELIELGSGSSVKTKILIEAMRSVGCRRYAPFEISESALRQAADELTSEYDWLEIHGLIGDFDSDLPKLPYNGKRMIVILGSSVGNYNMAADSERFMFLQKISAIMREGDSLLLGIDLQKATKDHLSTYNDPEGLNKLFNFRSFAVINKELDANFSIDDFEYVLRWDEKKMAVSSFLAAKRSVKVFIKGIPMEIEFNEGEIATWDFVQVHSSTGDWGTSSVGA